MRHLARWCVLLSIAGFVSLAPTVGAAQSLGLPEWAMVGFDYSALVSPIKGIISEQGKPTTRLEKGKIRRLVVMDADLTFIDSLIPIVLRNASNGTLLHHPETDRLVVLGVSGKHSTSEEIAELKRAYPKVPWERYERDYRESGSLLGIQMSPGIPEQLDYLRSVEKDSAVRSFVVTARSGDFAAEFLNESLRRRGVNVDGVLTPNNRGVAESLALMRNPSWRTAQRKAVTIAGLVSMYGASSIQSLQYFEDNDSNLIASMQLLPYLFPSVQFQFYDIIHRGDHKFERVLIAQSNGRGGVVDSNGKPMTEESIAAYASEDAPMKPDPRFRVYSPKGTEKHSAN